MDRINKLLKNLNREMKVRIAKFDDETTKLKVNDESVFSSRLLSDDQTSPHKSDYFPH